MGIIQLGIDPRTGLSNLVKTPRTYDEPVEVWNPTSYQIRTKGLDGVFYTFETGQSHIIPRNEALSLCSKENGLKLGLVIVELDKKDDQKYRLERKVEALKSRLNFDMERGPKNFETLTLEAQRGSGMHIVKDSYYLSVEKEIKELQKAIIQTEKELADVQ